MRVSASESPSLIVIDGELREEGRNERGERRREERGNCEERPRPVPRGQPREVVIRRVVCARDQSFTSAPRCIVR